MWVSTTLVDSKNKTVVRIIKNEFQAFPETAFNPLQPDEHSLLVRDATGATVLDLRFLNPRTIRIVGRFSMEGVGTFIIDPEEGALFPSGGGLKGLTLDLTEAPSASAIGL